MKIKLLLAAIFVASACVCHSQYTYQIKLVSFEGYSESEALSIISKKIDHSTKHIDDQVIVIESRYNYSEKKLSNIIDEAGFVLESYTMTKHIEKIMAREQKQ